MGQYHAIANLDRGIGIHPRQFHSFVKLTEFGQSGHGPMGALAVLLTDQWRMQRLAIVGDYAEDSDLPDCGAFAAPVSNLYGLIAASDHQPVADMLNATAGITCTPSEWLGSEGFAVEADGRRHTRPLLIVNWDRGEYLDPTEFGCAPQLRALVEVGAFSGGPLTALAAALAVSNGRGGGDLWPPEQFTPLIGAWAGDRISVEADTFSVRVGRVDASPAYKAMLAAAGEAGYVPTGSGWARTDFEGGVVPAA